MIVIHQNQTAVLDLNYGMIINANVDAQMFKLHVLVVNNTTISLARVDVHLENLKNVPAKLNGLMLHALVDVETSAETVEMQRNSMTISANVNAKTKMK